MIQASDVQKILNRIPHGSTLTVRQLQNLVEKHVILTAEDWAPYTDTRTTRYPHWKNVLQKELFHYKERDKVLHQKPLQKYLFL